MAKDVEASIDFAMACAAPIDVELGFEQAARRLRAGWLRCVASETASVLRSPTAEETERLSRTSHDAYGYERDYQPERLEERCHRFFDPPPDRWTSAHVLFSSGQAALATILLHLAEASPGKLKAAHVGSYFETKDLLDRACAPCDVAGADCVIAEPVACDGTFTTHNLGALAAQLTGGQTLVVDETLSAPVSHLPAILCAPVARGATVVRLVSGLKLLQQGLELANVGIVSVYSQESGRARALLEGLKRCRTLMGAGLRFVDALALEAPFFLDGRRTHAYANRVFAHNTALARAVMAKNRLFKPLGEARLAGSTAPYCAFELANDNTAERLHEIADRIERGAMERGLLIERGGSFGFRGHRYEVIEPEAGEQPFLRVALGARSDNSFRGLVRLIAELATAASC